MSPIPSVLQSVGVGSVPQATALFVSGLTALAGAAVTVLGLRGYNRNRNRTLLYLACGVCLLTTVPFVVRLLTRFCTALTATDAVLAAQTFTVAGLVLILYGFTWGR